MGETANKMVINIVINSLFKGTMALGYGLMIMLDDKSSMFVGLYAFFFFLQPYYNNSAVQVVYPLVAGIGLGGLCKSWMSYKHRTSLTLR